MAGLHILIHTIAKKKKKRFAPNFVNVLRIQIHQNHNMTFIRKKN